MSENTYNLKQHIEAILFWKGDPMSLQSLVKLTSSGGGTEKTVSSALEELRQDLADRGIVLISHDGEYMLGTNPKSASLIESARKDELTKDIGKAGLETLAIVLYQGPIRRSEIDYIRGVNSNFILRNLLIRGLVERKQDPKDNRATVYSPSMELIRFLGIAQVTELEDFNKVKESILRFKARDGEPEEK